MDRAITNLKFFGIGVGLVWLIAFSMNSSASEMHADGDIYSSGVAGILKVYPFEVGVEYTFKATFEAESGRFVVRLDDWITVVNGPFDHTFVYGGSSNPGIYPMTADPAVGWVRNISVYPTSSPPDDSEALPVLLDVQTFNQTTVDNQKIWTASFLSCAFMLGVIAGRFR